MTEGPSTSSSTQVILYNLLKVIFIKSIILNTQNENKVTLVNLIIV